MARVKRSDAPELELAEALTELDRKRGSSSARTDCPSTSELRRFTSGKCPRSQADLILIHLGSCQHCTVVLTKLRTQRLLLKRAYMAMAAAAAILIAAWIAKGRHSFPHNEIATIDLRPLSATRGTGNQVEPLAVISRRIGTLRAVLPIGSEGRYECEIRLAGEGRAVARSSGETVLESGRVILNLPMDLESLPPGRYLLALRHNGSEWASYPVELK